MHLCTLMEEKDYTSTSQPNAIKCHLSWLAFGLPWDSLTKCILGTCLFHLCPSKSSLKWGSKSSGMLCDMLVGFTRYEWYSNLWCIFTPLLLWKLIDAGLISFSLFFFNIWFCYSVILWQMWFTFLMIRPLGTLHTSALKEGMFEPF